MQAALTPQAIDGLDRKLIARSLPKGPAAGTEGFKSNEDMALCIQIANSHCVTMDIIKGLMSTQFDVPQNDLRDSNTGINSSPRP